MSAPNTHFGASTIARMLSEVDAVYFLGIGGVSMSSLAVMTARRGLLVAGYDRAKTSRIDDLTAQGITVYHTPDAAHIDSFGAVVYTVAISEEHPEYREAQRRGLPLISRADYLGYLMMDYKKRIGISGSHGKSTATCMCARIFMSAQTDPTVLSGAEMRSMGGAFRLGGRETMVFEACEYKDSFLDFNPSVAVILNAELDHVDYFRNMEQLRSSFAAFADRVGGAGTVIYNADDAETVLAMQAVRARRVTFGRLDENADYSAGNVRLNGGYASFDLQYHGQRLGRVGLRVPGEHNIYNALAAAAAAHVCGLCADDIVKGLQDFSGAVRRMEYKGMLNGARVYDDYAHHPTEVLATLREARLLGKGRLICAFQPHTYSRTATLFEQYVTALQQADAVVIAPIYAARETNTCGMSATRLASALPDGRAIGYEHMEQVASALCRLAEPRDTVVVMGAGNIDGIFAELPLQNDTCSTWNKNVD